jgi:8-oxo-dGTP diphosphatase
MKQGFDYPGVTIVYFCHDGKGNYILAKRTEKARDEHGRWDIGAGGLDFGISVEETLRKEIKEEYCTDVLGYDFLGYRDVHRTYKGKQTHWITLDFKVKIDPNKVKIGEPHKFSEVGFFTLDQLPEPVHSQLPKALSLYRNKL